MAGIDLDEKKRMICPYCGEKVRINDLLFAGKEHDIMFDACLARFYLDMTGRLPEKLKSRELFSWREFTSDCITVNQGIVRELILPCGERLTDQACIKCHNRIIENMVDREPVFVFDKGEFTPVLKTLSLARPDMVRYISLCPDSDILYWECFGHWLEVCESSMEENIEDQRCTAMFQNSGSYIFILELEEYDGINPCIDNETVDDLKYILDTWFQVYMIYKPVIFLLKTSGEDRVPDNELKNNHESLINYLNNICQSSYDICFWDGKAETIMNILPGKMNSLFQK